MKTPAVFAVLVWLTQVAIQAGGSTVRELTFYVFAGQVECLFEELNVGDEVVLDYQVIDGGHGDLDISLAVYDTRRAVLFRTFKKSEGSHRHRVLEAGDYGVCFDNTFSTFNRKTVFMELSVEGAKATASYEPTLGNTLNAEGLNSQQLYEMKVMDIMAYISRIHTILSKARQIQDMLRSNEARDRNLAEANFLKVNNWSLFQVTAMIVVGLLQVFLVRSIFDTNTRMSKIWQKVGY